MPPTEATAAAIGKSVQIYGEVKGSEDLLVDGTIEGTITLSESRLTIGPNAHVQANVSARDVVVLGALTGDVLASGRVDLRAGSNLKGDIRAARLSIEENAIFSGKVDLAASERPSAGHSASTASTSASKPSEALLNATN
ncbi:MAG TPA: polymer-forming cytoskeletal protein [Acidobacteriaceae bacterium]|nr:polymer-forming cytoskeletal protein [Acidobacteriaceae bacterium]